MDDIANLAVFIGLFTDASQWIDEKCLQYLIVWLSTSETYASAFCNNYYCNNMYFVRTAGLKLNFNISYLCDNRFYFYLINNIGMFMINEELKEMPIKISVTTKNWARNVYMYMYIYIYIKVVVRGTSRCSVVLLCVKNR